MNIPQLKNKIFSKIILGLAMSISLLAVPISVNALSVSPSNYFASNSGQTACAALSSLNPNQSCGSNSSTTVNTLIQTIVNIMSIIVGIVAVIMIIVSGMKFITSGGESQKVSSAKTTLIYALIGLAVVALSQAIVHFTVHQAANSIVSSSNVSKKKKSG